MSACYPKSMPLNIQISFCFSRYLDVKLSKNMESSSVNKISVDLAYKEQSTFNFVPFSSNISPDYKGSIVPSYMHRIYNRCTTNTSISHHLTFMMKMLECRDQDLSVVRKKYKSFMDKRLYPNSHKRNYTYNGPVLIHYDAASNSHVFVKDVIFETYKKVGVTMPPIVHRSMPKIMSILTSKGAVIRKIGSHIVNN